MPSIGSYADTSELPPQGSAGSNLEDYNPTTTSPDAGTIFTSPLSSSGNINFGNLGSTLSNITGMTPAQMAVIAGGGQMLSNAGQFTTQSQQDAAYLDPAQQFQTGYGQQLQALEANPSSVANTPGYQFALNQDLGAVNRQDMMKGGAVPDSDDISFASGLASQTYNTQVAQLTQLSGANFSPQSAASILQTGMLGNIGAQTAGMNALTAGLLNPNNPTNTSGSPVTFTPGGTSIPNPTSSGGGGFTVPGSSSPNPSSPNFNGPPSPYDPNSPTFTGPPPPDYTVNTDNGGSAFDPSMFGIGG